MDNRPSTLKAVIEAISAHDDVPHKTRTELNSAIRTFCRCVGRDPSEVDANPVAIRSLAGFAKLKLAGVSEAHFRNTMSRLTKALARVGIAVDRRRNMPLGSAWEELLGSMPEMKRVDLRKFAGWCSARGIEPSAIDQVVFENYFAFLEEQSVQANVRERWRRAWRAWNQVVAVEESGYPHIDSIFLERERLISLSQLPPQFASELLEFRKAVTRSAIFAAGGAFIVAAGAGAFAERLSRARRKPLRAVTADGYARNLTLLAGYLVRDGVSPEYFASLARLLDPDLVLRGLERIQQDVLAERARQRSSTTGRAEVLPHDDPNQPAPIVTAVAFAVLSLAKHLKAEPETLAAIKTLASATRVKRDGMTQKNAFRLNQLADPRAKQLLLDLPATIFARYDGVDKATFKQAREVQNAAILAVLLELPLRVENVAYLDLDRHFQRPVHGGPGKWLVSIPGHEVKNGKDINGEFTEETSALLDRYVAVFRPALSAQLSSALFPSRTGQAKRRTTVSTQFYQFVRHETGFELNAHIMRHFAVNNWLDAHPEDAETARQLLGHRSIDTTRKFYAGLDQRRSFRLYHEVIEAIRSAPNDAAKPTFDFSRKKRGSSK
jgi:integrase